MSNQRVVRAAIPALLAVVAAACGTPVTAGDLGGDLTTAAVDAEPGDFAVVADLVRPDLTAAIDLAPPREDSQPAACKGTVDDCGQPGQCASCMASTLGHQCVQSACGCVVAADCDKGRACVKGRCELKGCDANSPCNGGCCDRGACVDGTEARTCGNDGKTCGGCGDGTPTCTAGACVAACVVGKPGDAGVCGTGFCCGSDDQCHKIANDSCAPAGGLCANCVKSPAGSKCLMNGSCGCASQFECARGQACKAGVCGAACDANSPCFDGCCSNGRCVDGNTGAACAAGGALCVNCAGNPKGSFCLIVNNVPVCGCASLSDCPLNSTCDPVARTCTTKCDANRPCNGGCCSAAPNGTCIIGTAAGACGNNGGLCADCVNTPQGGRLCLAAPGGGACGCNTINDCTPGALSCDAQKHVCDFACSLAKPCAVGCCNIPKGMQNGSCASGQVATACGKAGACTDCSVSVAGRACRATQQCGCDKTSDCPVGQACDLNLSTCTTKCNPNQPCSGGCCQSGTCTPGTDGTACGSSGYVCVDCSTSKFGNGCLGGKACGCEKTADCDVPQACDLAKKECTDVCNPNQPCNGGCCAAGLCGDGASNSRCGVAGKDCTVCAGATPTCDKGTCSARCGGLGDGMCDSGNCCSAGKCVAGTSQTTCGYSGACERCLNLSIGTRCLAPPNSKDWGCGCEAKADCVASEPNANQPGLACDTNTKSCTSLCGLMGLTGCNGGCCSGLNGTCRSGSRDNACGASGGFCVDCKVTCQPGPRCDAQTGACGCYTAFASPNDLSCNGLFACFTNGVNRYGCNLTTNSCCIPGTSRFKDNGNPANCCTGQSANGICTCGLAGESAGDPPGEWNCCALAYGMDGKCSCLKIGAKANFGSGVDNRACCSLKVQGDLCVAAAKDEPCQTNDGCTAPQTCQMGKCG